MITLAVDYESVSAARENFAAIFDAAIRGRAVTIRRGEQTVAITSADRLRAHLFQALAARAEVDFEDGRWIVVLADWPFVSEGNTVDEAIADLIVSLREYAQDWDERLRIAPNHEQNWALVQLVNLSTDEELLEWVEHGGR